MIDYEAIREELEREEKVDSASEYLEKVNRIKKEKNRLKRTLKEIDKSKKSAVESAINDVAFMAVMMEDLRENIIRDGTTVEYKNGENQFGTKQSPDAQLYLQFSQKHTQAMKILLECLPKTEKPVKKDDGFNDFVLEREDI